MVVISLAGSRGYLPGIEPDWRSPMAMSDFDECVEQFQGALDAFFRGNAEPAKALMSRREDVTLANPFGPIARGWPEVDETMDRAALNYRDGGATGFEIATVYATPELGYAIWVERFTSKVGARDEAVSGALRRTTVFRPESGSWRVVHTHADPITSSRPAESLISR